MLIESSFNTILPLTWWEDSHMTKNSGLFWVISTLAVNMNSQTGLDYIIENKEFTSKLATGK